MFKLVTVLVPVYNVEKYIEEAVLSIINQTYKNLEIILIDDYSTDSTYEILTKMAKRDERLVILRNLEGKGIVNALNTGLENAKGDYILRMDGDDISIYNRVEVLVRYLDNNLDISLVGSSYIGIDENGIEISRTNMIDNLKYIERTDLISIPILHIWLARKETYNIVGKYRIDTVEDYDFLLRMKSKKLKYTNTKEYLYKVRIRNGNTSSTKGLKQVKSIKYIKKLYKERKKCNEDSFNHTSYSKNIETRRIEEKFFIFSQKCLKEAIVSKNVVKKVIYFFIAIISSRYTFNYILKKIIVNVIKFIYQVLIKVKYERNISKTSN